ncbi:MAG TPA: hypothetical protein VE081_01930 [Sporichthyaceae bacterium]|nr:hypothetical protein [Sporichthyaceae bacterium]
MRTKPVTGRRWTGGRARWAGTAAAALALVAVTSGGAGNAAATAIPTRADFDYIGKFANVADAPPGTAPIGGTAAMVVTTRATTTSINATGLDPKNVYIADVHDQPCFIGEGGGRFLFDPTGPKVPPNAIWLSPITVTAAGRGTATTTSAAPAGPRAKSVVIHLKRAAGAKAEEVNPPKLACADLPRVTS